MKLHVKFVPVLVGIFLAVALGAAGEWGATAGSDASSVTIVAGAENEIGWP
ncbi:hypothetical protein ACLF6K_25420 [Streptomyces xanthophaeus]|uniref:hypothetical protein n=1 Tax=Streptomyces xanthophaeus TaxID=67385 RepID=UPI00398FDDAC